jgi:hypothetical protein
MAISEDPPVCEQCESNARANEAAGYHALAAKCRRYCRNGHREIPDVRLLDAGWLESGKSFVTVVMLDEKSYVHLSLPEGYIVFEAVQDLEQVEMVKNHVADLYEEGEKDARARLAQASGDLLGNSQDDDVSVDEMRAAADGSV